MSKEKQELTPKQCNRMLNIFGVIVVILACTQAYILLNDNHNEEHKVKENKNYGSHSLDDGHGHAKEELETMTKHENIDKMLFEKMLQSLQNTKSSNLEEQKNIEKAIESMKKIKEENEEVHKGQNH
jgi:hypothetical protein